MAAREEALSTRAAEDGRPQGRAEVRWAKTIQQQVKQRHGRRVQEPLLRGPGADTGQREGVVRALGAGTPELEEWIQQILCLQARQRELDRPRHCAHAHHARTPCGGLDPTLIISSTILALYTFCRNDKNAQAASILFFPED